MGYGDSLLADIEDDDEDVGSSLLADVGGGSPDLEPPASAGPPVTLNDKGRKSQLEQTGDWYTKHYGTPGDTASTLGGGALEYLSTILGFAPGATGAARAGLGAAAGAMGGAGGAIKEGGDAGEVGLSTLLGTILGAVPEAAGQAGRKLGEGFEAIARKGKNVVAGSNAREAGAILDKYGAEADTDMLGQLLDKYSPSSLFRPRSSAGHLQNVAPQRQVQGQRVQDAINKAGYDEGVNDLVPEAFERWQSNVDDRALEAMRRPAGGEQQDLARAFADKADEVHAMEPPQDLAEFVSDKSGYQSSGARKGAVGYAEKARDVADQMAGGEAKDMVAELMGHAQPETLARWDNARQQTHELAMLEELLAAKKAGESTAGDIGSTIGSGVIGGGLGGIAGAVNPDDGLTPLGGAAMGAGGALAGAFGLTGGATRTAIRQAGGTGLADLGANVSRSLGHGASALGAGASSMTPLAAAGAQSTGRALAGQTHGHELPSVVRNAMQNQPELLAPFAQQLMDAEARGELNDELLRLQDNPEFQTLSARLTGGR